MPEVRVASLKDRPGPCIVATSKVSKLHHTKPVNILAIRVK
jgi:hypothetical protein